MKRLFDLVLALCAAVVLVLPVLMIVVAMRLGLPMNSLDAQGMCKSIHTCRILGAADETHY